MLEIGGIRDRLEGSVVHISFPKDFQYDSKVAHHRMGAFLGCNGMGTGWDDVCLRVDVQHLIPRRAFMYLEITGYEGNWNDLAVLRKDAPNTEAVLLLQL